MVFKYIFHQISAMLLHLRFNDEERAIHTPDNLFYWGCSFFNDYQLAQHRRRELPVKHAVEHVGPQADGTWVLGPNIFFDGEGILQDPNQSKYWKYVPRTRNCTSKYCLFNPASSLNKPLYSWVKTNMRHNFVPSMILAGRCCMALHYKRILETFLFCPIPIAYGTTSGTGKTTSLIVGLNPTEAYPSRFISRATYQKYADLCSSSYIPLGVDDLKSKSAISDLVIALFNGAKAATMKHGESTPTSMAVISATVEQEKYGQVAVVVDQNSLYLLH